MEAGPAPGFVPILLEDPPVDRPVMDMKSMAYKTLLNLMGLVYVIAILSCCSGRNGGDLAVCPGERAVYTIYVMNRGIHTGIIIPVDEISGNIVAALGFIGKAEYADFGWGEEEVYQASHDTISMDLRAVTIPSSSVMRVEHFPGDPESMAWGSDWTLMFRLTERGYRKLCAAVDSSFTRDKNRHLVRTSVEAGGDVIFFKSVHTYCGLNTCNTWVADTLHSSGLDVSSCMVITERGLYKELKGRGTVIKARK